MCEPLPRHRHSVPTTTRGPNRHSGCPTPEHRVPSSWQRLQNGDALHMVRLREGVKRPQGPYAVARVTCIGDVTRQRSRVAGDVGDGPRSERRDVLDDRLAGPGAWRVEYYHVCMNPLSY